MAGPVLQPVPRQLRAGPRRLRLRHAVRLRPGADQPVRRLVQFGQLRRARRSCRTTRTPGRSSRRSCTTRPKAAAPSTGTIYWQANKGWPSLLWNLYNTDGDQAGSFFGAKKANEPLHVLYGYDDGTVTVDNLGGASPGRAVRRVEGLRPGRQRARRPAGGRRQPGQPAGAQADVLTPKVPAATAPPAAAQTYFVELLLRQGGTVVDRNVYWLLDPAGRGRLGRDAGQPAGDDDPVRRPAGAALAAGQQHPGGRSRPGGSPVPTAPTGWPR